MGSVMSGTKWTRGPWKANLHHTQKSAGRTYGFISGNGVVPVAAVTLCVEGYDALLRARGTLFNAIRAASNFADFDASEHETIKQADAALALARGEAA